MPSLEASLDHRCQNTPTQAACGHADNKESVHFCTETGRYTDIEKIHQRRRRGMRAMRYNDKDSACVKLTHNWVNSRIGLKIHHRSSMPLGYSTSQTDRNRVLIPVRNAATDWPTSAELRRSAKHTYGEVVSEKRAAHLSFPHVLQLLSASSLSQYHLLRVDIHVQHIS